MDADADMKINYGDSTADALPSFDYPDPVEDDDDPLQIEPAQEDDEEEVSMADESSGLLPPGGDAEMLVVEDYEENGVEEAEMLASEASGATHHHDGKEWDQVDLPVSTDAAMAAAASSPRSTDSSLSTTVAAPILHPGFASPPHTLASASEDGNQVSAVGTSAVDPEAYETTMPFTSVVNDSGSSSTAIAPIAPPPTSPTSLPTPGASSTSAEPPSPGSTAQPVITAHPTPTPTPQAHSAAFDPESTLASQHQHTEDGTLSQGQSVENRGTNGIVIHQRQSQSPATFSDPSAPAVQENEVRIVQTPDPDGGRDRLNVDMVQTNSGGSKELRAKGGMVRQVNHVKVYKRGEDCASHTHSGGTMVRPKVDKESLEVVDLSNVIGPDEIATPGDVDESRRIGGDGVALGSSSHGEKGTSDDAASNSPDNSAPSTLKAPIVFLSFQNETFNLFGSDESTEFNPDYPALFSEPKEHELYYDQIESFFEALHDVLPELEGKEDEIILNFEAIGIALPEDNVYTREVCLYDLDRIHVGCGLPGRLHIVLEHQPRFSTGFNALVKHIANSYASEEGEEAQLAEEDLASSTALERVEVEGEDAPEPDPTDVDGDGEPRGGEGNGTIQVEEYEEITEYVAIDVEGNGDSTVAGEVETTEVEAVEDGEETVAEVGEQKQGEEEGKNAVEVTEEGGEVQTSAEEAIDAIEAEEEATREEGESGDGGAEAEGGGEIENQEHAEEDGEGEGEGEYQDGEWLEGEGGQDESIYFDGEQGEESFDHGGDDTVDREEDYEYDESALADMGAEDLAAVIEGAQEDYLESETLEGELGAEQVDGDVGGEEEYYVEEELGGGEGDELHGEQDIEEQAPDREFEDAEYKEETGGADTIAGGLENADVTDATLVQPSSASPSAPLTISTTADATPASNTEVAQTEVEDDSAALDDEAAPVDDATSELPDPTQDVLAETGAAADEAALPSGRVGDDLENALSPKRSRDDTSSAPLESGVGDSSDPAASKRPRLDDAEAPLA